jgi:hypothetical protein
MFTLCRPLSKEEPNGVTTDTNKSKRPSEEEISMAEAKKSRIKKDTRRCLFCDLAWLTHAGNSENSGFKRQKYRNILNGLHILV